MCRSCRCVVMRLGVGQVGEAEERRHRLAQRLLHGAEAELDLGARLERGQPVQVRVRPGVDADRCGRGGRIRAPSRGRPRPCARRRRRSPWCNAPAGPRARAWCRRAGARRRRSAPPRRRPGCSCSLYWKPKRGPALVSISATRDTPSALGPGVQASCATAGASVRRACHRPSARPAARPRWFAFSPPRRPCPRPHRDRGFLHAPQTRASRCSRAEEST